MKYKIKKPTKELILISSAIFLIALLPRLLLSFSSTELPSSDAAGYDDRAMNILQGRGFSNEKGELTSCHEPFYSFFLAAIYYFFGHNYLAVRIIQSALGAFGCVIIFIISIAFFNLQTAIIAALIASFNPGFIKITEYLMTENLFTFLLLVAMFFLTRQTQKHNFKNFILIGISLGLATLTRSITFLFPLFILLFLGRHLIPVTYNLKRYILSIIIFISFFTLTILPWTLRNWRIYHRFMPISSKLGLVLYSSYFPKDGKLYGFIPRDSTIRQSELLGSEVEQSNFLCKETLRFIKNNPLRVLKLEVFKIIYFWSPFDWEIIGYGVYNFMYGFIFPFFIYGIFLTRKIFRKLLPVYLPLIYSFIIALITFGSPRYRLPFEPYLIIIGSAGISYFTLNFSKKIYAILLTVIYFFFNVLLYINSCQTKLVVKNFFEKLHLW